MEQAQIKVGDYVLLTDKGMEQVKGRKYAIYGQRQLPGRVVGTGRYPSFYVNVSFRGTLDFDSDAGTWSFTGSDSLKNLGDDISAYRANIDEYKTGLQQLHKKAVDALLAPVPKIPWEDRPLITENKKMYNTGCNFASKGTWDRETNTFTYLTHIYKGGCCSFTKTTEDLRVYIPKVWLTHYGYTKADLTKWLEFVKKCDIGFEYEFEGEVSLHEGFKEKFKMMGITEDRIKAIGPVEIGVKNAATGLISMAPSGMDGFYGIKIQHGKCKYQTYIYFILLRYIYNYHYWTIPATAMLIKKQLGKKVTYLQALLMAHLREPYYDYYNLVSHKKYGQVDVFQSIQPVFDYLDSGRILLKVNDAWKYTNYGDVSKFFEEKDFNGLYNQLKLKQDDKVI